MPVITYAGGSIADEKKKELIKNFTSAASEVTGIPRQSFTVLIQEYKDENIGIGGEALNDIKARRSAESK